METQGHDTHANNAVPANVPRVGRRLLIVNVSDGKLVFP